MVIRGVQMFLGLAPDRAGAVWGPLAEVVDLCGLTLDGGVEQDGGSATEGPEAQQPARNRNHLRLVAHRRNP